jgi:hypothetical protein
MCVCNAGANLWIKSPRLLMRGKRGFEEPAVPASLCQACKQLRIIAAHLSAIKQTHHGVLRTPEIGFELSIDVMRQWKIRAKLECLLDGILGAHEVLIRFAAPFGYQAKASAEPGPSWRILWVLFDAPYLQVARHTHLRPVMIEQVAAQIVFVSRRARWHVVLEPAMLPGRQGQRERFYDAIHQIIL